ncbi:MULTISPECIES: oxaloacetate decarboxylase subunit alpha [unclassified Enterococcus]|uniref:oxaloacetate decarboxylase subunit alpha n=1 Tax=unclassified Enterococcus TaxID=2608891 RepID=UPI001553C2EA|nr:MULTISPECIES: oxaloacetate decarboxylase subunit alpha [unclassified Enterococcus]MBS7575934.1 oxaloacetate decarboxylase subunit alpha [Enterococcus sp. MMGLQ5-2]MBS7583167.1 oxaloacetate decarboxylase subunit alpha [Enterococcus sp. MMGLQ5-1]NPD11027.1 oxaloacetate decarboxylase subunit alpha [Enterococcus sp. MMGLQ5-1]NPD35770.1 oxaloacetate decarboxylase subunit alpha [Enterococcus sp. MMGLQ5-2]
MITRTIKITETVLRDAQQSLIATRMPIEDMIPILEEMDEAGYEAVECWGGATFDSCLRYLNEDPWERLRIFRKKFKKTKLLMLLRGQSLLGYRHYADDVVDAFVKQFILNGIDIIRIFDALNDVRNIESCLKACKKYGGHAQLAIAYTVSPIHTVDYFTELATKLAKMGADSLCIKDMAGIMTPDVAYKLVSNIKSAVNLPLEVHTHATAGISKMTYLKALEAGADMIDTAISPFSGGTSQPATESMVLGMSGLGFKTDLNMDRLNEIAIYFKKIRSKYHENGLLKLKMLYTDPRALTYQVPGGMLSNLLSQLTQQGLEGKFDTVLNEVPNVRMDLGYPPLVTPLSQMVGTQALMNVLTGQRYQLVSSEIKNYLLGKYGQAVAPIDEDLRQSIIGDEAVIRGRPADLLEAELPRLTEEIADYAKNIEDVLDYALFPQIARDFLGRREDRFYDIPIQEIEVII